MDGARPLIHVAALQVWSAYKTSLSTGCPTMNGTLVMAWVRILRGAGVTTDSLPRVRERSSSTMHTNPQEVSNPDVTDDKRHPRRKVALPRRRTRRKRSPPRGCYLCDQITGECSRIERQKRAASYLWWTNQSPPFEETSSVLYIQAKQQT